MGRTASRFPPPPRNGYPKTADPIFATVLYSRGCSHATADVHGRVLFKVFVVRLGVHCHLLLAGQWAKHLPDVQRFLSLPVDNGLLASSCPSVRPVPCRTKETEDPKALFTTSPAIFPSLFRFSPIARRPMATDSFPAAVNVSRSTSSIFCPSLNVVCIRHFRNSQPAQTVGLLWRSKILYSQNWIAPDVSSYVLLFLADLVSASLDYCSLNFQRTSFIILYYILRNGAISGHVQT